MKNQDRFAVKSPEFVWLNGESVPWAEATIPVIAMGASGSLAVFEGIKAYWNAEHKSLHVFRLHAHLARLYDSMKIVHMKPAFSQDKMEQAIIHLLERLNQKANTSIRPVAFYDGVSAPSFRHTLDAQPDLLVWTKPFQSHLLESKGKHCAVSSWTRISDNSVPPRVKCMSNYQNNRMAMIPSLLDGYDDVILLDANGKVTEASAACIFIVRDGTVATPPTTAGILESITRDSVFRLIREDLHLPVVERVVDRTELYLAEEVFLCGTAEEITAVLSVDRLPVGDGQPGPTFRAVEEAYYNLVHGQSNSYPEWRTIINGNS
jgi:branched-chain amino acid aminotransferase